MFADTRGSENRRLLESDNASYESDNSNATTTSKKNDPILNIHEYNEDADKQQRQQDKEEHDRQVFDFYIFICVSTAFKSFEAGIISSMMADIQADFQLGYDDEGTITASPDYGIAPGALLAIAVFRHFSAHSILTAVLWGTAIVCMVCAMHPTLPTLLLARAVGGLLWSHAATHYPVWIDRHGPPDQKTIWLACTNVSLLVGILTGYVVGGLVRALELHAIISWVELYFLEGLLMAFCGILFASGFEPELLRIDGKNGNGNSRAERSQRQQQEDGNCILPPSQSTTATVTRDPEAPISRTGSNVSSSSTEDLVEVVQTLLGSSAFCLAVAVTGCVAGGIVFLLYFVTQVSEARGMDVITTLLLFTAVFSTAPAPGILLGSWIVNTLGGYTDHVVTFRVALGSAIIVLLAALAMPLSWSIWGDTWQLPYVIAVWVFCFAGAMSGPPLNGVAVSAVPQASHVASALQFAIANAAKIVVPQIGGYVCRFVGLIDGYNITLVGTAMVFVALSWSGMVQAKAKAVQNQNNNNARR